MMQVWADSLDDLKQEKSLLITDLITDSQIKVIKECSLSFIKIFNNINSILILEIILEVIQHVG